MGLDMYLTKKTFLWSQQRESEKTKIEIDGVDHINQKNVKRIEEEIGYWRKANAIHAWFVEHVQDGQDDCEEYEVSEEQLTELRDTCKKVLASTELVDGETIEVDEFEDGKMVKKPYTKRLLGDSQLAEELLPSQSGFFFGGTEYDEWYFKDLEETIKICEDALEASKKGCDITYSSSW